MFYTLYKSTNLKNKKFYIGVHATDDPNFGTIEYIDKYCGSGDYIWRALRKYGRKIFDVEVIAYFDSEKNAYLAEAELVTEKWLEEHKGKVYNIVPGGKGGFGKISRPRDEETKQQISNTIRIRFEEGNWIPNNGMLGRHHKEESKRKSSLSNLGKKRSNETRERCRQSALKRFARARGDII